MLARMAQTTPEILRIKANVRQRDGMRCTRCGITAEDHIDRTGRTLDVHRIEPGSVYSLEGCITLCRKCHGPEPRSKRQTGKGCLNHRMTKRYVSIPKRICDVLEAMGERNLLTLAQQVKEALVEYLKDHGEWPPKEHQ